MSKDGYGFAYSQGLNLANLDETTAKEKADFWADKMAWREGKMMYPLSAYSFLMENRPDMLKLHLRQMQFLHAVPANGEIPMAITMLTMLHWYACNRVVEGVDHEVRGSQQMGASKAQVNEIFGLAFMHSGPSGFREVYHQAFDYMKSYQEPKNSIQWPANWGPDPDAFKSGLNFSNPEFTKNEQQLLGKWYESTIGYVPRSVQMLSKYNPSFMKAHRAKFEGAMATGALPKQMVPYILIHYNMNRGFGEGIREGALLGKAWGMTRDQVINAITLGTGYMAGIDGLYIVDEVIGELLESWD